MRTRLTFLATVVIAMGFVASGLTGNQFSFTDWPMAPGPAKADKVIVDDSSDVDVPAIKMADNESGTSSTKSVSKKRTAKGGSATVVATSSTSDTRTKARRGSDRAGDGDSSGRSRGGRDADNDEPRGGDDTSQNGSVDPGAGSDSGPSGTTGANSNATPTTPVDDTPGGVSTASANPAPQTSTPARTEPDPSPAPAPEPTPAPAPAPEPTTPPTTTPGGGNTGPRRGLLGQLLHGLLGGRNIQP